MEFILIFHDFLARDLCGADVVTWTRGSTNWAGIDPRGHLRGVEAEWLIGPMGIVGPEIA